MPNFMTVAGNQTDEISFDEHDAAAMVADAEQSPQREALFGLLEPETCDPEANVEWICRHIEHSIVEVLLAGDTGESSLRARYRAEDVTDYTETDFRSALDPLLR